MDGLFLKMVNMSISASWLVPAVIVLRFLLKKAPKWLNPVLWGIVGFRLICPFSIESAWSLIPSAETIDTTRYVTRPYIESGIRAVDRPVNEYLGSRYVEGVTVSANHFSDITKVFAVFWLFGMIALLIYTLVSYCRLRKKVETAILLRDNIYQSENVVSPFVLGVWCPRVYLPFYIEERDMIHVIAHEQTHIRRHDQWIKLFGFLLLSMYWFNPVLWAAYLLLCRDIEFACDERVIRELGTDERADYSQALLNCSVSRRMLSACPLAFGESGVKRRVKNVLNYKKPAFWIILIAIVSCIAAAVCFLTDPFKKEAVDPETILGKTYSIGRIVYADGSDLPFSKEERLPDYRIAEEKKLFTNEGSEWHCCGEMSEIFLTKDNFDRCFLNKEGWDKGTAGGLRRTNEKAWKAVNEESGIFYYILLQSNGDLYLTRGKKDSEIQKVFRMGHAFVINTEKETEQRSAPVTAVGQLGDDGYHFSKEFPVDTFEQETVIYETTADVTHDGKRDLIQLVAYHTDSDKTIMEILKNSGNIFYVKVYRGSDEGRFETVPRFISRSFALAHAGNGNVFLSHREGQDYLLFNTLYQGQGAADYDYTAVYISDQEGIVEMDGDSADFTESEEEPERSYIGNIVREFKERLSPWIEEASVLLALNVNGDVQVAEKGKKIPAKKFFDTALKVDPDIEQWYSDEELCQMAKAYYMFHEGTESEPQYIEISKGLKMGEADIWLYDIWEGMGRTLARYTVDKMTAKGYESTLFEEVDLTEAAK